MATVSEPSAGTKALTSMNIDREHRVPKGKERGIRRKEETTDEIAVKRGKVGGAILNCGSMGVARRSFVVCGVRKEERVACARMVGGNLLVIYWRVSPSTASGLPDLRAGGSALTPLPTSLA